MRTLFENSVRRGRSFAKPLVLFAVSMGIVSVGSPASATALERKSLSDLAKGSELIFEGTVVAKKVVALANGQGARTCFTFKIAEVIAGTIPGKTAHLCFFGGEINGQGFAVSDMRYPDMGEHGIYLVESTRESMLNPLIGCDQGRFLVAKDAATGVSKVMTADGARVSGLTDAAARPTPAAQEVVSPDATAVGVLSDSKHDLGGAISRDAFVAKLRSYRGR
jgi:hypothetical protein